ncbi:MAG: hypothetical protein ACJ798_07825 [Phenylobacterium sp.]
MPIVVVGAGLAVAANYGTEYRGFAFLGALLLLAGELAIIGWLVNDRPIGAFIDNRNRISLSKLQAGAWTVVVLAALSTIAIYNVLAQGAESGVTDLDIAIPGELLLAMGISATSLVAAPALLSLKADQQTTDAVVKEADSRVDFDVRPTVGKVLTRPAEEDASWGDLVTGDEIGNAGVPDLGKIQQLLITVLLLGCYVAYLFIDLSTSAAPIHTMPALDKSFVWLLGLSHASYLAYKAAPHTKTA